MTVLVRPSSSCKTTDPSYRQRGCYIRTITVGVQLEKEILIMDLKGLVTKTN
jgi:hypothetical protein